MKTVAFENQEFHPLETLAIGHTKFGCAYFFFQPPPAKFLLLHFPFECSPPHPYSNRFIFLVSLFSAAQSPPVYIPSSTQSTSRSGCHKRWQVESALQQQQPSRRPQVLALRQVRKKGKRKYEDWACVCCLCTVLSTLSMYTL